MFAIHSNQTIIGNEVRDATVVIKDGHIADILDGMPDMGIEIIDAGNKVLMAGIIDPHVHINEPGRTEWEGFDTATKAAIAGGITCLVEMPLNASPVTTTVNAFDKKITAASGKLHTNCGFWGGVVPGNEHDIVPLIEKGVLGFKAFLTHSGIDEFPNVTEQDLRRVMPVISHYGLPLLVHCELDDGQEHPAAVNTSYQAYLASRPSEWEDRAIALMIRLCEESKCRTHIVHLSSSNSLEPIRRAKERGIPLTVETAQHYLYFTAESISEGQTQFKCAPPIREKENNEKLWQGLKDGIIDFVATDHSPAPPALKAMDSGDFNKAWGGISSIQFALPALWTGAKNRHCSLPEISRWLCSQTAILAGLAMKGKIEKGSDADLVVWDPSACFNVTKDIIMHKHSITPYLGEQLYGIAEQTYLGGVKVFDRGDFVLDKGRVILGK
ncbi:MAG TPA: allantoinase AllB [Ferruginibacter sp.]|nr:allantoinase AllB [Ferruginibacter sp.]